MSNMKVFNGLMLIARPAAGKSEIIAHLKATPLEKRIRSYRVGKIHRLDDFPMLWTWFEEDRIRTRLGLPRVHSDLEENFLHDYQWDILIERINLEYTKLDRDQSQLGIKETALIEFARGKSQGGFQRAFAHLSRELLKQVAILYINVSWEESLRKNRARFNPDKPDSILEHGLSDKKMEALYRESDWDQVAGSSRDWLEIQGIQVPFKVFDNEDDVTSRGGPELGQRLEQILGDLFQIYQARG